MLSQVPSHGRSHWEPTLRDIWECSLEQPWAAGALPRSSGHQESSDGICWVALQQIPCASVVHLMSPSFCVHAEGELTGCVGQERSFSVKVVFIESSDSVFIQIPFGKGLAEVREPFLALFLANLLGNSDVHSLT